MDGFEAVESMDNAIAFGKLLKVFKLEISEGKGRYFSSCFLFILGGKEKHLSVEIL